MAATENPDFDAETIEAFKEQTPFIYDREKRYYGFVSGSGAGKTVSGLARTELNAEEWNQGAMGAIIAPTTRMIKNNIIPLMRKFGYLDEWEYKSTHSDEPGIHLGGPSGGRILLLSASDERTIEYLNGLSLAYIWMDEHRDIPERATEIAVQRLRAGDYRNMYITTTPRGKNHTYDFFVGDQDPEQYGWGEATIYETPDRICIGAVPSYANPHTPEDYKQSLGEDLPDAIRAQEVQGEFVEIGSGVLTKDMLTPAPPKAVESGELTFHVGVDLGIESDSQRARENDSDYWAASVIAHHRRHGEAFVIDVKRKRGMSMKQGLDWLETVIQGVPQPTINIESVHAQEYLLQRAKERGLPVQGVNQSMNKEDRLIQLSVPVESDRIKFVNMREPVENGLEDRWSDFVNEWIAFPDGSHDDLLDAVEIGLRNIGLGATFGMDGLDMYGRDE